MKGTVGSDKEGNMEQMILAVLAVLAVVALCWGVYIMSWETVKARVHLAISLVKRL